MRQWVEGGRFRSAVREIGLRAMAFHVFAALIPFGGVMPLPFLMVGTSILALALLSGILLDEPEATRGLFRATQFIMGILIITILLQSLSLGFFGYEHERWAMARTLLHMSGGAISLEPGDTRFALLTVAMPAAIFLLGLLYCDTDARSDTLLALMGTGGGLIALFAICQFILYPKYLLVIEKKEYLDSLTGVFVNRNTAATFFGLVLLINLARIRDHVPTIVLIRRPAGLFKQLSFLLMIVFAGAAALSLMLTRSRAGIAASGIALLIYAPFLVSDLIKQHSRPGRIGSHPFLWAALTFSLILITLLIFSGQAIMRMKVRGIIEDDRYCIFPSLLRAAGDNWLTGSGFGAFRTTFAPYRNADCGIFGIFDKAHNSFLEGFIGLGIVFPIVLVAGLAGLLVTFVIGFRERRRAKHYSLLGLSALLLVFLHAASDFSLQVPGFALYLSASLAAVCSICLARHKMRPAALPPVTGSQPATSTPKPAGGMMESGVER